MAFWNNTTMPTVGTPIVGNQTQDAYLNALYNSGMSQKDDGGWQFNQMPSYQGQLTPNYNNNLTSTWGAYSPNGGGMPQGQQQWNAIYAGQQGTNQDMMRIQQGGWGSSADAMGRLSLTGSPSGGSDYMRQWAEGQRPGPMQQMYMGGQDPLSGWGRGGGGVPRGGGVRPGGGTLAAPGQIPGAVMQQPMGAPPSPGQQMGPGQYSQMGGGQPTQGMQQPGAYGAFSSDASANPFGGAGYGSGQYGAAFGNVQQPGNGAAQGAPVMPTLNLGAATQYMGGGPGGGSQMPGAGSIGGSQNMPNNPNGGMPGYNANFSNIPDNTPPWQSQMMMGGPGQTTEYLNNIASGQGAGAPVDQTPAWDAMVKSQNFNINRGANQLAEQFNQGGGLFSTAYGGAQAQYQSDARNQQNAQLLGASTQAMQGANQNQFGAAQQLGQFGFQGGQGAAGRQFGADQQMSSQRFGAAMQDSQQRFGAGQQVSQNAANATMGMWNGQNQAGMANMSNQTQLMGMGMQGSNQLNNMWNANLGMGSQLGGQQYGMDQNALMADYQRWFANQPYNNPYLQMMNSAAFGYPQMVQPTVTPGWGSQLVTAAAQGAGAAAGAYAASDRRVKTAIKKVGTFADLPLYTYKFKGAGDQVHVGVMAQEAFKKYPAAVLKGDKTNIWMVDYSKLASLALGAN